MQNHTNCKSCPYIIINNTTEIEECYCDKLGDVIKYYGSCDEDGVDNVGKKHTENKRKWNRYERKMRYKRKLEQLVEECHSGYIGGAWYVITKEKYNEWNPRENTYYDYAKDNYKFIKRTYRANHAPGASGYLKKLASRKFRRYKGELADGCAYKKIFDYWWELY